MQAILTKHGAYFINMYLHVRFPYVLDPANICWTIC